MIKKKKKLGSQDKRKFCWQLEFQNVLSRSSPSYKSKQSEET